MKEIILMVGIPGSGKSTYFYEKLNSPTTSYINADSVRKSLYGDENIQGDGAKVFSEVYKQFVNALECDDIKTIVVDNTNTSFKTRKHYYKLIKEHYHSEWYKIKLIFFDNFDLAKERNKNRNRVVPEDVMERMIKQYEGPNEWERYNCNISHERN